MDDDDDDDVVVVTLSSHNGPVWLLGQSHVKGVVDDDDDDDVAISSDDDEDDDDDDDDELEKGLENVRRRHCPWFKHKIGQTLEQSKLQKPDGQMHWESWQIPPLLQTAHSAWTTTGRAPTTKIATTTESSNVMVDVVVVVLVLVVVLLVVVVIVVLKDGNRFILVIECRFVSVL
jgi:hypothetical protein